MRMYKKKHQREKLDKSKMRMYKNISVKNSQRAKWECIKKHQREKLAKSKMRINKKTSAWKKSLRAKWECIKKTSAWKTR